MTQQGSAADQTKSGNTGGSVTVGDVRFEHRQEALGIGTARPRISWIVSTEAKGWLQTGYEIQACGPDGQIIGQTGKVSSDQSVLVEWPFAPLASRQRVTVQVRVWGTEQQPSNWSDPMVVEAALLNPADWKAQFVTPDWEEDPAQPKPSPFLRREFAVRPGLTQARLYVTALGLYEAEINGKPVGDHVMAPGWTSYNHRLRYQIFDVSELLQQGQNAIGAMLGDGWYRGRLAFGGGHRNIYGNQVALLAQLELTYADGTTEQVLTDPTWRAAAGPILSSEIYDGETYDARLERPGWSTPGYDDSDWIGTRTVERDFKSLFAPYGPPVRRTQLVAPVAITKSPSGRTIVDFGQNLVGRLRITVQGPASQVITMRHAEVLEGGELSIRPLRAAKATDQYSLRGEGVETWEARFTFHGFRYAEVEGWPGELKADDLRAVVCHSDMQRTGWFECSDPLINRLHENVVWGMRGNFLDIPTDCPQRDERLGWTGDIQVFSPTASFLYDASGFLTSWLVDLAVEQKQFGVVPFVVPTVMGGNPPGAAWGDAAVVVPWVLYQRFGDTKVLENQFESMCAWVDLLEKVAGESRLWDTGFQFGDWLDPSAPPDNPGAARTPGYIVATAYFAHSAELTGQAAQVLGRTEAAARYLKLAAEVRDAFNREYVTPSGRMVADASTAYALALQFALLPSESQRRHAGQRLVDLARSSGYRISTGFVGTPLICDALCAVGEYTAAFRLLTQRECPSWLYPVTMGATTIWERWDSLLPDGSVNPGEMTSFNHYALGAVADWMHRTVAGLAPAAPGYRQLEIKPRVGARLTHARAAHLTPYGMAEAAWKLEDGQFTLDVVVPPNTTATVTLPGNKDAKPVEVGSGKYQWTYRYEDPQTARPPLTLDSSLNDMMDDEQGLEAVMNIMKQHAPWLAENMGSGMHGNGGMTLRQVLSFMPQASGLIPVVEAALAAVKR